ncbi:MAG: hypothetical protein PVI57_04640 [Gemmatimonadota bacterium]
MSTDQAGRDPAGRVPRGGDVLGIIRRVRRRWRLRILLRGLSITLAAALAAFLLSAWALEAVRFSAGAVAALRVVAWGLVAVVGVAFLVRPLLRRVGDRQVALYLEEHEPSLEASILGAVEAERTAGASPLLRELVARAVERARDVDFGRRVEQRGLYRYTGTLAALSVVAVVLAVLAPQGVRHGLGALLVPTTDAADVSPYSIAVEPGDATVARGSDLFVRAHLEGFESQEVFLFTTAEGAASPRRLSMIPGGETGGLHELLLLDLQEPVEYFVESDGVRSPTYRLEVADLPYVDRMDHTYRYPAYTGLPERVVEDGGDVVGVAGTRVDVVVHPTIPAPAGRLVVEGRDPIELQPSADGSLRGTLPVDEAGFYRVELARARVPAGGEDDDPWVEASPRYTIDVTRDLGPSITVTEPGRDAPVSPIEEVYVEARADDDYGVDRVRLVYSVNGGPQDTVAVFEGGTPPLREVTAGHTLFLEEWPLEPGDMVSYFVEARDVRATGGGRWVTSDLYFLEIRPFRRDFREREQQGGGMPQGGGQAGAETALSELQQQVTVATFNLIRDGEEYTPEELSENLTSVALAQGRVREQVGTLLQRMRNRGIAEAEDQFREIAEMLPEALEDMQESEERLRAGEPGEALPPQQRALRVLQKAEETYERYVGTQQQGGGGGGGGANAEDLADLFELELDKLRNQYETVQRGERQQQNAEADELMEKLEELSRRQEQELERQRQRAAQRNQAGGGGGSDSQRALADETEEAARQLERLARETGDARLQETARRLQDAAESMRRSAAQSGGTSGAAEAESALDRLAEAERRLRRSREDRLEEDAEAALDRIERLAESQEEVQEGLERLSDDPSERAEQLRRLEERKDGMQRETGDLEQQLDRMAADARRDDPTTADELREAADRIRESKLEAKIAWSKGVMRERDREFARGFEEEIASDIDAVREQLEQAARAARELSEDRSAEETLERARELVRGAESLGRRLERRPGAEGDETAGTGEPRADRSDDPTGREGDEASAAGERAGEQEGGRAGEPTAGAEGGQRGGDRAGGQPRGGVAGRTSDDDRPPGGGATRGNPRPFSPEEIRQFRRSFEEQLEAARQLRQELAREGRSVEELDDAVDALERLSNTRTYRDLPQIALLQEELQQSLKRVEFTLRREVEGADAGRAFLRGSDDVPAAFRELVEEYYRSLAREGGGGGGG